MLTALSGRYRLVPSRSLCTEAASPTLTDLDRGQVPRTRTSQLPTPKNGVDGIRRCAGFTTLCGAWGSLYYTSQGLAVTEKRLLSSAKTICQNLAWGQVKRGAKVLPLFFFIVSR